VRQFEKHERAPIVAAHPLKLNGCRPIGALPRKIEPDALTQILQAARREVQIQLTFESVRSPKGSAGPQTALGRHGL
jgi:hypothetical protein